MGKTAFPDVQQLLRNAIHWLHFASGRDEFTGKSQESGGISDGTPHASVHVDYVDHIGRVRNPSAREPFVNRKFDTDASIEPRKRPEKTQ